MSKKKRKKLLPQKKKKWTCDDCLLENPENLKKCQACKAPKIN